MADKELVLATQHKALGAKMIDFSGFQMPIQYEGVNIEHQTVREKAGVFDVSHMGEFILEGAGALPLLQYICSNDIAKIKVGGAQYNCMPNERGGIVDDVIVYRLGVNRFLMVVNAANIEKDWNHIHQYSSKFEVSIKNASESYGLLAVQGPLATKAMQSLCEISLGKIPYYHFQVTTFAGIPNVIVSATGYTGAGGLELYCATEHLSALWEAVLVAGSAFGIKPIGLAARDTLRLEMGYCLYGNDITDTTSPLEAGLAWITKLKKGDFVGRDVMLAQKEAGMTRKRVGFELLDKGIARSGHEIVDASGRAIGSVTSGTKAPTLQKAIGMGYVATAHAHEESEIYIQVRKKQLRAKVVRMPFS